MTIMKRREAREGPLTKALRTNKEAMRTTINQNREVGCGETSKHPFPSLGTKAKMPHEIGEELSMDMVIGFFQVQLADNARNA
jgi:hypothetical protein